MEATPLDRIADWAGGQLLTGASESLIRDISTDSRVEKPDSLFVALVGPNFDGRQYVGAAAKNGSIAALTHGESPCEIPETLSHVKTDDSLRAMGRMASQYRRQFDLPVIAVE